MDQRVNKDELVQVNIQMPESVLNDLRDRHGVDSNAEAVRLEYGIEPPSPQKDDSRWFALLSEMRQEYKSRAPGERTKVLDEYKLRIEQETGKVMTQATLRWWCNSKRAGKRLGSKAP